MPDERKNNLLYNFFSLGIVQVITSLLQLIVIPYVISKIGVGGFGAVAVAQVVMFYLSAFTEYGFNQSATRNVSLHRYDRVMISRIFFRVMFSKIILCVLSFIILLVMIWCIPFFRAHALLYLSGFIFVIGQTVLINWFFQGMEKMQLMAFTLLLARLLFVLLVFLFIKSGADDVLYLFFLGAGNFIMGVSSIFFVIRKFNLQFFLPARSEIRDEFREGWKVTVTNLANNICQYSNIFILRFFTNDLVTGYYGIAERVFLTIRQMLGIFSQAVYPQVCRLAENGRDTIVAYFKRVYVPFLGAVIGGSILLFVLAPRVLYFFIGHEFTSAVGLLRVFAVVLFVAALNIPATLVLLAKDHRQGYFKVYTTGAVLNILLNLFLAGYLGAVGTVTAVLITELFIVSGLTVEVLKLYANKTIIQKAPF